MSVRCEVDEKPRLSHMDRLVHFPMQNFTRAGNPHGCWGSGGEGGDVYMGVYTEWRNRKLSFGGASLSILETRLRPVARPAKTNPQLGDHSLSAAAS